MNQNHKKKVMRALYRRADGKCEQCGCPVGLAFELLKRGWKLKSDWYLYHPAVPPIACATIEHVVPRSRGGTSHWFNLRLYCQGCNGETSNETQHVETFGGCREVVSDNRGRLGGLGANAARLHGLNDAALNALAQDTMATGAGDIVEGAVELRPAN